MTGCKPPDPAPDGFTGAILAVEGIRDAAVLLNGPTGCKFYHGAVSEGQLPRETSMDPLQFSEEFYFGQPRVPATYLDAQDYIFGATEKLSKMLPKVAEKGHRLIAVVNSPGAALIGDDLERFIASAGLPIPCVAIESTGFSDRFTRGFQRSVIQVLERLNPPAVSLQARFVNLIGLSIQHRHWEGDAAELRRLLGLCGIGVNAVVCAGCTAAELRTMGAAKNVVVHAEYADELSAFLEDRIETGMLVPEAGPPVGFSDTEAWIRSVCRALKADPGPALADIREARTRAFQALSRFNSLTGLPGGATFALHADGSTALSLTRWLYEYLGMVPTAVSVSEATEDQPAEIRRYLTRIGCADAWEADLSGLEPDLVFGGEGFISLFRTEGMPVAGIDIALPGSGDVEVIPKCQLGATGALWLLERILNGLLSGVG